MKCSECITWDFGALGEREITVYFHWTAPSDGGFDEPPTSEDYEVESIKMNDFEIMWMFSDSDIEKVVDAIKDN